jgi:IS30 family transposase
MSKNYTQLSLTQRYQIEVLKKAGLKQNQMASTLGVHPSTISRELRRNTAQRGRRAGCYVADNAHRRTKQRHKEKPKLIQFTTPMKQQAAQWLRQKKWSPELISVMGCSTGLCPVSHEWLYQWIWACKKGNKRADRSFKPCTMSLNRAEEEENVELVEIPGVSSPTGYRLSKDLMWSIKENESAALR